MNQPFDVAMVRDAIASGRIEWRRHALERMFERNISRAQVFETLLNGTVIEDYPDDYPWPSALFLGWSGSSAIHVLVACHLAGNRVAIITAYEPDEEHFEPDFRTRKRP